MALNLLKRAEKGSALTSTEHDDNFTAIEAAVDAIPVESSLAVVTTVAEFNTAVADTSKAVIRMPGTYIFGSGNTETTIGRSGLIIEGFRGQTIIKAHNAFSTSQGSEATYKFLWRATGQSNITLRGLSIRQDSDDVGVWQSKVCFKTCTGVKITDCDTEGNGGWDFLFLTCTGFEVSYCEFTQGIGGNTGVGCRIAGKSSKFKVFNNWFHGKTVTKNQEGSGNQPSGDLWGSVGLNIDCSQVTNTNSNEFKGGKGRILSTEADGSGNATVTVTGIDATDWKAFIHQVVDPAVLSGTSHRAPRVAITANTLNFSQFPGGPALEYEYFYFYLGHTPRDGEVYGNTFEGMIWVGCSIINGFDINTHHNIYKHIGDVSFDPEGCFRVHCTDSIFVDCYIPCNPAGYQTIFERNVIEGGTISFISSLDGSAGGTYQAFSALHSHSDFGSDQFDGVSITVAAPSGNNQTITGSANCFNHLFINERIQITHSSATHTYLVTVKTSSTSITVDKTTRRLYTTPDGASTDLTIPAATYAAGTWKKYPYLANAYGLTGRVSFRNNKIKGFLLGLEARNQIGVVISGNDFD
jgi:hypothetical protein